MKYVRVRSWHVVKHVAGGDWWTRCGRTLPVSDDPPLDAIPLDEKTCETCLRLTRHDEERA